MPRPAFGLAAAVVLTLGAVGQAAAQDITFFRIASGSAGGTYFPIAAVIAEAVSNPPGSRACEEGGACGVPGLVAVAQSSHASVANVTAVQSGQLESGLAAADIVYTAYHGTGAFEERGAYDQLRVIASLFPEHLQLVLPAGTELGSIADLEGKRVGIAQAGSGTQVVVLELLELFDIGRDDIEAAELDNVQSAERLAAGELDAYFYVAGTPTAAMVQLAATVGMELYSFSEEEIAAFLEVVPYYYEAEIPAGTYEGVDHAVRTVAVGAQWVTSSAQPADLIHAVTAAMWNDNSRKLFDQGHAKGADITADTALDGVRTPLHAGAERYYREAGLIRE
ncbi:MAG: TAXI family TRAP transporter solute-binding subunit [Alphaproteobacteria bacterium]|jgi:TRAP transporter TAXI family solute receptor|nr:TAXI family TRAP transporter solute-binding subunit [Alphaproteobacteria bacterium]